MLTHLHIIIGLHVCALCNVNDTEGKGVVMRLLGY